MHIFSITAGNLAHDQAAQACVMPSGLHASLVLQDETRRGSLLVFLRLPEYALTLSHLFKSVPWFRMPHFWAIKLRYPGFSFWTKGLLGAAPAIGGCPAEIQAQVNPAWSHAERVLLLKMLAPTSLFFLEIDANINICHQEIIWLIVFLVSPGCFCLICKVTESLKLQQI